MEKYKWNLDYIYKNDQEFLDDLEVLRGLNEDQLLLEGKLNNKDGYLKLIEIEEREAIIGNKMNLYSNIYSLDQTNLDFIRILNKWESLDNEYRDRLSWMVPELDEIKKEDALSWVKDSKYSHYKNDIERFYRLKEHRLGKKETEIVTIVARSRSAASSIYSELTVSDAKTPVLNYKGKEISLTQNEYTKIMKYSDPINDRELRELVTIEYYKSYYNNKFTLSSIYQKIAEKYSENTKLTKFDSTLDRALFSYGIPKEVYFKLLEVSAKHKEIPSKNSKLFANYLTRKYEMKELKTSDAQLELFASKKIYKIDDSLEIIGRVAKSISEEYYAVFKEVTKPGFIDYLEGENKVKGAYSTGNIIFKPLILMNWTNDLNSLLTLAHEIGHSIHTVLSNENQDIPYQSYSIYLAEIASTILEMLVIDDLASRATDPTERMHLLDNKLSTQIGTFFRQAQFADFEMQVLEGVFKGEIFDYKKFSDLFSKTSKKYNGEKNFKRVNSDMKYTWTRISHFFGSPYYVYQYATSIAASFNFIEKVKKGNSEDFISLLKAGSSKMPNDILLENGIDLSKEETYKPLLDSMKSTLKEIEELYGKL